MRRRDFTILSFAIGVASQQICYWPNGTRNDKVKPCPTREGKAAAACCFSDAYCMENGLCYWPKDGTHYRGGCTDKTWQADGCPKYCHEPAIQGGVVGAHVGVFPCGDKKTACLTTDNCAKNSFKVEGNWTMLTDDLILKDMGLAATCTSAASGTSGAAAETSGAAAGTPAASSCPTTTVAVTSAATEGSGSVTVGAAAGIGAGIGIPLLAVIAALSYLLHRERKGSRATAAGSTAAELAAPHEQPKEAYSPPPPWAPAPQRFELHQ